MMGAARSASLRDVAPLNAGTARFFWRGAPMRHSTLALPGLSGKSHSALALPMFLGVEEALATRDWHCQRLLAREGLSPLNAGTAKDYWRGAPTRHSGLALPGNGALAPCAPALHAACANCNASLSAPPVKWPIRDTNPTERSTPCSPSSASRSTPL